MAETIKIGGELESTATGNKVADASAIKDGANGNKSQAEFNSDVVRHENEINGSNGLDSRLRTVEELAEISVGGGDIGIGTAADFESDDPEDFAKVPTVGAMLGGANDGVYDISARHNGTKYADLAAALGTNGANVPVGVRRGGMSIKFVQSSDNSYVQYRLTAQSFTTNVDLWQEEGDIEDCRRLYAYKDLYNIVNPVFCHEQKYLQANTGNIVDATTLSPDLLSRVSDYIPVFFDGVGRDVYSVNSYKGSLGSTVASWVSYGRDKNVIRVHNALNDASDRHYDYQSGEYFVRFSFLGLANNPISMANYGNEALDPVQYIEGYNLKKIEERVTELEQNPALKTVGLMPININWIEKSILNREGIVATNDAFVGRFVSKLIPVNESETYYVNASRAESGITSCICYYNSSKVFVKALYDIPNRVANDYKIVIPTGVSYIRVSYIASDTPNPGVFQIYPFSHLSKIENNYLNKLDKKPSYNLIDLDNCLYGYYIGTDGVISQAVSNKFFVSDYIPVNGQNIQSNARSISPVSAWNVYDENYALLRTSANDGNTPNYTYQNGDAYIRFCFWTSLFNEDYPDAFACYGDTLLEYIPFGNYLPIINLQKEVDELKKGVIKPELTITLPNYVYCICDNKENYSLGFYADHCVSLDNTKKAKLIFKNSGKDYIDLFAPIENSGPNYSAVYNGGQNKLETPISDVITGDYADKNVSFTLRSILNTYTKDTPIRVLCIGDSVTNGTGSQDENGILQTYWRFMQELCILDNRHHSNTGYTFVSIGKQSHIEYQFEGATRNVFAEGRGGWNIDNYLHDETYNNKDNYFYDGTKVWSGEYADELNTAGVKFSLQSYLAKYKTLADDGVTRLVVGNTAGTEITDINECDVCTPNIIVIQLSHNQNSADFAANMPLMIKALKNEYPNIPILLSIIDETGCYNFERYPNYDEKSVQYTNLHAQSYNNVAICKTIESTFSGVYFCPSIYIQPTAESTQCREVNKATSLISSTPYSNLNVITGAGPSWHPAGYAHAAWGYQMLAMIKWILN